MLPFPALSLPGTRAAVPRDTAALPGAQGGWDGVPGGSISLCRLSAAQWPGSLPWHATAAVSSSCACTSPGQGAGWLLLGGNEAQSPWERVGGAELCPPAQLCAPQPSPEGADPQHLTVGSGTWLESHLSSG